MSTSIIWMLRTFDQVPSSLLESKLLTSSSPHDVMARSVIDKKMKLRYLNFLIIFISTFLHLLINVGQVWLLCYLRLFTRGLLLLLSFGGLGLVGNCFLPPCKAQCKLRANQVCRGTAHWNENSFAEQHWWSGKRKASKKPTDFVRWAFRWICEKLISRQFWASL